MSKIQPSGPAAGPTGYRWTQVLAHAPFAPRDGAGALTYKGRMWLIGGWNPSDKEHFPKICSNDVWSSADGKSWRLEKPNTFTKPLGPRLGSVADFDIKKDWAGRHTAGYAVFKGKMWIVGGDANQYCYQDDVWSSEDGKAWTRMGGDGPMPWGPRVLHYTVAFKDRIWLIGGQTMPHYGGDAEVFYRDAWSTTDGVRWEKAATTPAWPQRGMIGGAAVFKDRIWLLGGGTYDTPTTPQRKFFNDVWSTADGEHWECVAATTPWHPRQYHDVAVWDEKLWVLEGWNQENRNDVWCSADGKEWHEVVGTPWAPRHAASVFVFNDALWMVAGNNMESDVWRLER